jgi:hypothetical protein
MYYIQFYDHPGPVLLGYPMHRPRTYASLIFKVGFVWHGSSEHYKETFLRSLEVNGSAYYVANETELQEELQLLLQRRGRTLPSGTSASDVDWGSSTRSASRAGCRSTLRRSGGSTRTATEPT